MRNLTLTDVRVRSGGIFQPSSLGSYERGERAISLERFCILAQVLGIPPDRLLNMILSESAPAGRRPVVIDLNRLSHVEGKVAGELGRFVHDVKTKRGDFLSHVVSLRSGDIEQLALSTSANPAKVLEWLKPAITSSGSSV
jgi:transcriptional regulator with XRE-family HTH domain